MYKKTKFLTMNKILITGGAGFIGTHLSKRLLQEGFEVRIFDSFSSQVHASNKTLHKDIANHVDLIVGDVRDSNSFKEALAGQEVVVHLAAETGTGQSMYEVERYESANIQGTAILFDHLVNNANRTVDKVVVASSRSIYGEGKYQCNDHGFVYPGVRKQEDLLNGKFEPTCPICDEECSLVATDEESNLHPTSFYGLTKQVQEQMTLMFARTMGISGFALRYQNVYGPGQSLNNPYTGILAIFANQARENKPINIFEDGKESRDFVYIEDVIDATLGCIKHTENVIDSLNVGSGESTTVLEVAKEIVEFFKSESEITITGNFRNGDIRHNVASLDKIKKLLNYDPKWHFKDGISQFLNWAEGQKVENNGYETSLRELREKGLLNG
jgi:dTDP-L-rhamnose 4-epimerase